MENDTGNVNDDEFEWIRVPRPTSYPTNVVLESVIASDIAITFNVTQQISNCSEIRKEDINTYDIFISGIYQGCDSMYDLQISEGYMRSDGNQTCKISYTVYSYILPNFRNTEDAYTSIIKCLNSTEANDLMEASYYQTTIVERSSSSTRDKKEFSFKWIFLLACMFFSLVILLLVIWIICIKKKNHRPKGWDAWPGHQSTLLYRYISRFV